MHTLYAIPPQKMIDHHADMIKFYWLMIAFLVCSFILDPSFAVTVEDLQAPIDTLKAEIFGGWMVAVKVGAAAAGIVLSAFRGSFAPFGIGAGLSLGIHLYDQYLGETVAGALI